MIEKVVYSVIWNKIVRVRVRVRIQITSLTIVYSSVYSGADQSKHQSSASLAFVRGIYRWPANSPHKGQVTRKMFPFDDIIMCNLGPILELGEFQDICPKRILDTNIPKLHSSIASTSVVESFWNCTEYVGIFAVSYAKLQNDWTANK